MQTRLMPIEHNDQEREISRIILEIRARMPHKAANLLPQVVIYAFWVTLRWYNFFLYDFYKIKINVWGNLKIDLLYLYIFSKFIKQNMWMCSVSFYICHNKFIFYETLPSCINCFDSLIFSMYIFILVGFICYL